MKSLRQLTPLAVLLFLLTLFSGTALAWPSCSGNWIQVTSGTKQGTVGSGGVGSIVTEGGQTFECENPTPPPPTPSTGNTNTNNNSNTNSSSSNSGASSGSSSGVNNSGNSHVSVGPIKATGGQGGAGGSVSGSGNSTNNNNATGGNATGGNSTANGNGSGNTTTANGGNQQQGQKQQQSNSSTNNNQANGNGSNSNNTTNNVEAAKIPVDTAYAPTALPTVPCFKAYSGGGQAANFGFSMGGGKIDPNCAILETARSFGISGARLAYCKTMVTNKYAKKAGVTVEDCMQKSETNAAAETFRHTDVQPAPPVVVVVPREATPAIPIATLPLLTPPAAPITSTFLGFVTGFNNVTKAKLDDIVVLAKQDPNGHLRLRAGKNALAVADNIKAYLITNEVNGMRVEIRDDGDNHGVELLWISGD